MTSFRVSRHLIKTLWEEGQDERVSKEQVERVAKWCDFAVKSRMRHNEEVPPLKTMILELIFLEERLPNQRAVTDVDKSRELQNFSSQVERQRSNAPGQ